MDQNSIPSPHHPLACDGGADGVSGGDGGAEGVSGDDGGADGVCGVSGADGGDDGAILTRTED